MLLYHVSPTTNRESIKARGLLRTYSRGRTKSVWGCTRSRLRWAMQHVLGRHKEAEYGMDVWVISIDRERLKKTGKRSIWRTESDVPPCDVLLWMENSTRSTQNECPPQDGN